MLPGEEQPNGKAAIKTATVILFMSTLLLFVSSLLLLKPQPVTLDVDRTTCGNEATDLHTASRALGPASGDSV